MSTHNSAPSQSSSSSQAPSGYVVDGWQLPEELVGLWASMGYLFQLANDLETVAGARRFVVWWLEHGQRLYPGYAKEISSSLLSALHSSDYREPISLTEITPLMKIVYETRTDLQTQYPNLSDESSALGFWQWWHIAGSGTLGLENGGFPLDSGPAEKASFENVLGVARFIFLVTSEFAGKHREGADFDEASIHWWFQVGQRKASGLAVKVSSALLNKLHSDSCAMLRRPGFSTTPLMQLVYRYRPDLRSLYPDLSEEVYARTYWYWWCKNASNVFSLPNSGLPVGVIEAARQSSESLLTVVAFLMRLCGDVESASESDDDDLIYWWVARGRGVFEEIDVVLTGSIVAKYHVLSSYSCARGNFPAPTVLMQSVVSHRQDLSALFSDEASREGLWRWWHGYAARDYGIEFYGLPVLKSAEFLDSIGEINCEGLCFPFSQFTLLLCYLETNDSRINAYFCDVNSSPDLVGALSVWLPGGVASRYASAVPFILAPLIAPLLDADNKPAGLATEAFDRLRILCDLRKQTKNVSKADAQPVVRAIAYLEGFRGLRSSAELMDWWAQEGAEKFREIHAILSPFLDISPASSSSRLERDGGESASASAPQQDVCIDVQVVGYPSGQFGIGEDARLIYEASRCAYDSVRLFQAKREIGAKKLQYAGIEPIDKLGLSRCKIFCMPAFDTLALFHDVGQRPFVGGCRVGVWQWELERFPREARFAFDLVDEIWTISTFCRRALSEATDKPVLVLPVPVKAYEDDACTREDLGIPDDTYVFMTAFDGASFIARKNPLAVIEAFQRAFRPEDQAVIVIKAMNAQNDSLWRECLNRAASDSRIIVLDEVFSPARLASLFKQSDCVVSLHRAEGFGRIMADAFAHKKPVIASAYSGCMDFLSDENAYLVGGKLINIRESDYPFHKYGKWFNPDIDQAAHHMRRVFEQPAAAVLKGIRGHEVVSRRYSVDATSSFIKQRLSQIIGS